MGKTQPPDHPIWFRDCEAGSVDLMDHSILMHLPVGAVGDGSLSKEVDCRLESSSVCKVRWAT